MYLVFPWAEADLERYWREVHPEPTVDQPTVMWMADQCRGIASAVVEIHKYVSSNSRLHVGMDGHQHPFAHHGDIKPKNVLWFPGCSGGTVPGQGTLTLSDFGLAKFNTQHTASMQPPSRVAGTPEYRAPECDLREGGAIGRSYDIWTLGCLYLEFITWLLGGYELVEKFNDARRSPDPHWYQMATTTFFQIERTSDTGELRSTLKQPVIQVSNAIPCEASPRCVADYFFFSSSLLINFMLMQRALPSSTNSWI